MKLVTSSLLTFCAILLMTTLSAQSADSGETNKDKERLRNEIVRIMERAHLPMAETNATIKFTITNEDKIVVLGVKAETEQIENLVKRHLNQRRIKTQVKDKNKKFYIDVKMYGKDIANS